MIYMSQNADKAVVEDKVTARSLFSLRRSVVKFLAMPMQVPLPNDVRRELRFSLADTVMRFLLLIGIFL